MIKDMTLGQYYPVDSMIHRLDPRTKFIISFVYILAIFFLKEAYQYALLFIGLLGVIKLSKVPLARFGFPVSEMAMMMGIALRFIPTLTSETDKIMKAQMARGADFESGNIFRRAKSLIPILVPLFLSSIQRAIELADAMEARCYHGGEGRTRFHELSYKKTDYFALTIFILFFGILLCLPKII